MDDEPTCACGAVLDWVDDDNEWACPACGERTPDSGDHPDAP